MTRSFDIAALLVSLIAGCTEMTVYDQPGVTVARLDADLELCADAALSKAPPLITREYATVQEVSPDGLLELASMIEGADAGIVVMDVDHTAEKRERLRLACLREAGYELATAIPCHGRTAGSVTGQTTQAPAGPGSCGLEVPGVGPMIVSGH